MKDEINLRGLKTWKHRQKLCDVHIVGVHKNTNVDTTSNFLDFAWDTQHSKLPRLNVFIELF